MSENLGWPNGMTILSSSDLSGDPSGHYRGPTSDSAARIIWTDSKTHTLEMADLNGANRKILLTDLPSPYGVTVLDQVS